MPRGRNYGFIRPASPEARIMLGSKAIFYYYSIYIYCYYYYIIYYIYIYCNTSGGIGSTPNCCRLVNYGIAAWPINSFLGFKSESGDASNP